MVTSDDMSEQAADPYDAKIAGDAFQTPVGKARETCCKTFIEQGSGRVTLDDVNMRNRRS